jgi:DNA-binding IclR family transcriptional regulator
MNVNMQGYAVSKREHYPDIFGVAGPILCPNGNLQAIRVATMPYTGVSKNRQDQIVRKVVQTG